MHKIFQCIDAHVDWELRYKSKLNAVVLSSSKQYLSFILSPLKRKCKKIFSNYFSNIGLMHKYFYA